jgi:hypothetical protein
MTSELSFYTNRNYTELKHGNVIAVTITHAKIGGLSLLEIYISELRDVCSKNYFFRYDPIPPKSGECIKT